MPINPVPRSAFARTASLALAAVLLCRPAAAFDSKGHVVIEALAYRTLVEGHDGRPPQPDVLRDLFNDGDLAPPLCFGWGGHPPEYCADAATKNPLLDWPKPLTDQPDAAFRRQFSDAGQCFHFMGTLEDADTEPIAGTTVPRGLATSALVRCRDLLDDMLRQVVIEGGPGTMRSAYGLYEMMHAIEDSFSGSHTQRRPGTLEIEELRVWAPLTHLPGLASDRTARIPDSAFHKWDDHRDKTYVVEDREIAGGRRCKDATDEPYGVPFECLSEEGDSARKALVELLVIVRDQHAAVQAAPGAIPSPERSEAWVAYKARWLAPAYACEAEECRVKQAADLAPGAYAFLGLGTTYNATRKFFDATATGSLLRYSSALNPFVYSLGAEIGYRHFDDGAGAGLVGLQLDLILPLGKRAALGFTPAAWRLVFADDRISSDLSTRLFRFDYMISNRWALTMNGPLEVNWRKPAAELSFGLGLSYALTSPALAGGPLVQSHADKTERVDDQAWSPPEAPYGRLKGRRPSWYVGTGATTVETPAVVTEGRQYGSGSIGGMVLWDRDRWGGRFSWTPGGSIAIGVRATSGDSAYLTGALGLDLRWYALGVLGLSLTPVRIEGGPKVRGGSELDLTPGVHGAVGSQYYLQAGSRLGVAFNAGIVDILVQGPTLAWSSKPVGSHEILSVALSIRLD
jgi:hypothetical protein